MLKIRFTRFVKVLVSIAVSTVAYSCFTNHVYFTCVSASEETNFMNYTVGNSSNEDVENTLKDIFYYGKIYKKNYISSKEFNNMLNELKKIGRDGLFEKLDPFEIEDFEKEHCLKPVNVVDVEPISTSEINKKTTTYLKVKKFEINPKATSEIIGEHNGIEYDKLKEGDIITSVNGLNFSELKDDLSPYELNLIMEELQLNKKLDISFVRPKKNEEDKENNKFKYMRYKTNVDIDKLRDKVCFEKLSKETDFKEKVEDVKKKDTIYMQFYKIDFDAVALLEDMIKIINLETTKNIILDLSKCYFGNYTAAKKFASLFLPSKEPYVAVRNLILDSEVINLKNYSDQLIDTRRNEIELKIVVSKETSGAAEQVAKILRLLPTTKIYGEKTRNKSLEYDSIYICDDVDKTKILSYVKFPKLIYAAGNHGNFNSTGSLAIDIKCENARQVKESTVLDRELLVYPSEEEKRELKATTKNIKRSLPFSPFLKKVENDDSKVMKDFTESSIKYCEKKPKDVPKIIPIGTKNLKETPLLDRIRLCNAYLFMKWITNPTDNGKSTFFKDDEIKLLKKACSVINSDLSNKLASLNKKTNTNPNYLDVNKGDPTFLYSNSLNEKIEEDKKIKDTP